VLVPLFDSFGQDLPAVTRATLSLLGLLQLGAPTLLVLALGLIARARFRRWSGERELTLAATLLQWSSAVEAGLPEEAATQLFDPAASSLQASRALALDANERLYLTLAAPKDGAKLSAQRLAAHLLRRGRARAQQSRWVSALVGTVLMAVFVINVLGAMYLPIFSIAGAIK
jgi:hypothetical protein